MYIEAVPNRHSPPAILLRESFREGGKVKKRTLLNLSDWPAPLVAGLRALLKGGTVLAPGETPFQIQRSWPHGAVAAALGLLRALPLERLLDAAGERLGSLLRAMIVARLIAPASKLATAKALSLGTAASSLAPVLGLGEVDAEELYAALDWLLDQQPTIEAALAKRHLENGTLVLYDVSSSWLEGRCCPLAQFGHSRDRKSSKLQIVYGLLCAADGCPVAIEVFEGNTGDPTTLSTQIAKLKERFVLRHVVLVVGLQPTGLTRGDRGMITQARIDADLRPNGLDWITALRAPAIRGLVEGGALQLSLFDERDMAAVTSPDYPGERLIVCRNPALAAERARKREDLLQAAARDLTAIKEAVERARRPLRGIAKIARKVGAALDRRHMAKHFDLDIADDRFVFTRKAAAIAAEAALDGLYVVRTPVPADRLDDAAAVAAYKSLSRVERAFRSLKTVDLDIRPIFHYRAPRVRAHVFLCMLAYYLEWHLRNRLAPMLYDDHDRAAAEALRTSPVAKAPRSPAAHDKDSRGVTPDGLPVHSLQTLLADLATFTRNEVTTAAAPDRTLILYSRLTPLQQKAFDLLGIDPTRTQ
jgi:Transposase DDE domain